MRTFPHARVSVKRFSEMILPRALRGNGIPKAVFAITIKELLPV